MAPRVRWAALAATSLLHGCQGPPAEEAMIDPFADEAWRQTAIASPVERDAALSRVTTSPSGAVYLSWVERGDSETPSALWFSRLELTPGTERRWGAPRLVTRGSDWFLNWVDFPSVRALADGTLLAHWLVRSGASTYACHVHVALSCDGGATWTTPRVLHDDRSPTEHGFVSIVAVDDERFGAVWLDGRATANGGPMQLRFRTLDRDGTLGPEQLLDERVCDCCPTALVAGPDGELACAYRDRSENEIRDIAVVRGDADGFGEPQVVHDDGWEMPGCPVNGPALAWSGRRLAVAWYTGAGGGAGRVQLALAEGDGSFGAPLRVDDGAPEGRVDVTFAHGATVVAWLEHDEHGASWRYRPCRVVRGDGSLAASERIAAVSSDRDSGCLRMTNNGVGLVATWTEGDRTAPRVATAHIGPGSLVACVMKVEPRE